MNITDQELHRNLRSAARGELSDRLNSLECLNAHPTPQERARALLELLGRPIKRAYLDQQIASGESKVADLRRIRHDSEKLIVGVLYWHYFAPVPLSLFDIAQASGIRLKALRKHRKSGVQRLLTDLAAREHQAQLERLRDESLTCPRNRLTDRLTNKQQGLIRGIMDRADGPKRLFFIGGPAGGGKSSTALYLDTIIERTRQLIWIEVQPNYLDRYGVIQPLPHAVRSAEAIIAQMCEGLNLPKYDGLENQLSALERYPESAVFIINRVDALALPEWQKLQAALERLSRHVIVMTTRYRFQHPYGIFTRAPELPAEQSRAVLEQARNAKRTLPPLSDETFNRLYNLVGGNPLALTVLGTRLAHISAAQVEDDLKSAKPPFDTLFSYILQEPWRCLSSDGHDLLRYLCSYNQEWLSEGRLAQSDLGEQAAAAIEEAEKHYLIECQPTDDSRLVRLNPLVRTAVRSGISAAW
jgi:hypothetical protein